MGQPGRRGDEVEVVGDEHRKRPLRAAGDARVLRDRELDAAAGGGVQPRGVVVDEPLAIS